MYLLDIGVCRNVFWSLLTPYSFTPLVASNNDDHHEEKCNQALTISSQHNNARKEDKQTN